MSVGYRPGSFVAVESSRRQMMVAGSAAAAFVVTKMRPALVAAQTTFLSDGAWVFIETWPPERSSPNGPPPAGMVHAVVHAPFGAVAVGHSAAGPNVSRPAWPGSPIAFQSSQRSTAGTYVPSSLMSPSPSQYAQCSFTF